MSYSFEEKLRAVEHDLALRRWWLVESLSVKAYRPEQQFKHVEVLEAIAQDYRRAIARRNEPVNADNLCVVRAKTDA